MTRPYPCPISYTYNWKEKGDVGILKSLDSLFWLVSVRVKIEMFYKCEAKKMAILTNKIVRHPSFSKILILTHKYKKNQK